MLSLYPSSRSGDTRSAASSITAIPSIAIVPAILDVLAGTRGAVEINADPHRLDLPPSWIPAVRERQIPFVISVDAHSTRGLGVLRYGVTMARRGGVRKREVLNAMGADQFARLVVPKIPM